MKYYYHKDNGDIIEHILEYTDDDQPKGFYVKIIGEQVHHMMDATPNYQDIRIVKGSWLYYPAEKLHQEDTDACFIKLKGHKELSKQDMFLLML